MPRNPKIELDILKMYFDRPYHIDLDGVPGEIVVYPPMLGDIIDVGETKFRQTLSIFTANTTQYRVILWDLNMDWNEISDFDLFVMLYKGIDPESSKLLFGDLDWTKFEPLMIRRPKEDGSPPSEDDPAELILWDNEDEIEINYDVWNHFCQYLRAATNTYPEEKITNDSTLKQWYINKDKRELQRKKELAHEGKEPISSLQPLISACVNHPGFKYKKNELNQVSIFEFYDSVSRLAIYEQSIAIMRGMYGGFIDGKGIKPEDYNFMREIIRDTNNSVSKKLKDNG